MLVKELKNLTIVSLDRKEEIKARKAKLLAGFEKARNKVSKTCDLPLGEEGDCGVPGHEAERGLYVKNKEDYTNMFQTDEVLDWDEIAKSVEWKNDYLDEKINFKSL